MVLAGGIPVWRCDHCRGPAKWTFIDGHVYYHCEQQCDGFMQAELFIPDGVQDYMRGGDALDAGRTLVSEMNRFEEPSTLGDGNALWQD